MSKRRKKKRTWISKDTKSFIVATTIIFGSISLLFGGLHGMSYDSKDCFPKSIAAKYNLVYRLGCELSLPRYKRDCR